MKSKPTWTLYTNKKECPYCKSVDLAFIGKWLNYDQMGCHEARGYNCKCGCKIVVQY